MRSFCAAALLTLAVVTECLSAHSERSRQRSGPIRSVPVAADLKRDINFDCPEEFGYYPHPNDCSLYYVCVFGGALLESCTGGLMYSHELQTCDWPRNVGCDGTSAVGVEDVERVNEREETIPPTPPPRKAPPPPPTPPRVQPNPVITSRGQPKFNRDEYAKQQQLYAEVDDLPPVEEIESDRQQRVYRGQPSTIGQVQKDRDGYGSQVVNTRTLNSNVIPASIPQSTKLGSFSFGTQVDDRRATATPAPQTYSTDKSEYVTDPPLDKQLDFQTIEFDVTDVTKRLAIRRKREVTEKSDLTETTIADAERNSSSTISDRSDRDIIIEYDDIESDLRKDNNDEASEDEIERGKRQIRYILQKGGYKNSGNSWSDSKPIRFIDFQQFNYKPNGQNIKYQSNNNGVNIHNNQDQSPTHKYPSDNSVYSTANPLITFYTNGPVSQRPFKASFPDPFSDRYPHAPMNVATQIITKSPPISALKNNENPFSALAGGFYNNLQSQENQHNRDKTMYPFQSTSSINRPSNQNSFQDSSLLPSTVVTDKPVKLSTSPRTRTNYRVSQTSIQNTNESQKGHKKYPVENKNHRPVNIPPNRDADYNDDDEEEDEDKVNDTSEEDSDSDENEHDNHHFKHDFPDPPYEFTHPNHKYADIENPFADPNFDFDVFLAKLRGDTTIAVSTSKAPVKNHQVAVKIVNPANEYNNSEKFSTLNYQGMSTPRPFSVITGPEDISRPADLISFTSTTEKSQKYQQLIQHSQQNFNNYGQQLPHKYQQQSFDENAYNLPQQNAGIPFDAFKPKLKPPNFNDDRQLPITYNFNRPIASTPKPNYEKNKSETQQLYTVTQKPFVFFSSTGSPIYFSTPKQHFIVNPDKMISLQPNGKPYMISTIKPQNAYIKFKHPTTSKPLTTFANEQLSALQHYWNNPTTLTPFRHMQSTSRPDLPKLENLFAQAISSSFQPPIKKEQRTTTKPPVKRKPIPKPSPEMPDYYYDDEDEQYEPPIKSQYMPSSEVKPKRPPMAQNYQEYDDYEESEENSETSKPSRTPYLRPYKNKPETATKNHNDVSVVTKSPHKDSFEYINGKIPVNLMVNYATLAPNVLIRPEIANYEVVHHSPRNRTLLRRPINSQSGPFTARPPKYLNQTTLRPYTVRHRLAKPKTVKVTSTQSEDNRQVRGRVRHHNIVAQMKQTTPRDNHNQETRYTKTKHDDKTNRLEPTESILSPRPKMLYNGSQTYSPDQFDPYYAVYDEDGELYKDTVQQTFRGTPPTRRPVEVTQRPTQEDYDDALIHGQINQNQNQYQPAIRHPTRGEGNELGYDHNPSSAKTTLYEATTLSTTPTTSTSTTLRPTSAPLTEAMTPSRYTPRSSTDENLSNPETSSNKTPADGSDLPISSTFFPLVNFSSLAKPFEKTDNSYRLQDTITSTEKQLTSRFRMTKNNDTNFVEVVQPKRSDNKVVSLTTGFSIRRNPNSSNNPYTLTVLTRPFDTYNRTQSISSTETNVNKRNPVRPYFKNDNFNDAREESLESREDTEINNKERLELSIRRSDSSSKLVSEEHNKPIYTRPSKMKINPRIKLVSTTPSASTKYYLKTVIKRPAPFSSYNQQKEESNENIINTDNLIEVGLQNARNSVYLKTRLNTTKDEYPKWDKPEEPWNAPIVSPYRTLDNLKSIHTDDYSVDDHDQTTTSTTITPPKEYTRGAPRDLDLTSSKPSYYSYRVVDEDIPDHTTEVFSSSVKNIIKAFFDNFKPPPKPQITVSTTSSISTVHPEPEEKVVNIGFKKKPVNFSNEKPLRNNAQRIQIITEPTVDRFILPSVDSLGYTERENSLHEDFSSTTKSSVKTTPFTKEILTTYDRQNIPQSMGETFQSKLNAFIANNPESESIVHDKPILDSSLKFHKLITDEQRETDYHDKIAYNNADNEVTKRTKTNNDWNKPTNKIVNELVMTTSTTKSTTTKSISFPTRPSRVNPAIKLAAANPGGGRRSYQSPSKCSSDNSLQANPKCNEIKYQRPTSTRGRGSAHYTLSGSEAPQPPANRGTPPTRSRPTLKPSTVVVTNNNPFVDIYTSPPRRPGPVYPQPTPDKTAAKCRKDVCLLPDCYCGGKDIPGDLPVESVPQIVLLTFDDSVNDLNKGLYADLFEKGRVNPNGCPISATFYVSHEWTDYSQVQNLYSAGHEMASHTISHSFGEQFSQKKWNREVGGQREILAAYGGVKLEDVRGMRAPFLSVGGNKMFKMLHDSNFTYDSSLPVYENKPPSWPYTLDYKLFHDCMIPPCPTKSYPGVWEVPMVMWQDLNGGRCSMGDACANPPEPEGVYKMLLKNFDRHYTTNRAPFGLFYHAAWFTQPHHKEGFIMFLDFINQMNDVWIVTNWQALQWVRDPTPISRLNNFQPFQCNYQDRPKKCNNPKVCNLWHKSGVRYMRTCQPCPEIYPWTGKTGIKSSRIDNDIEE